MLLCRNLASIGDKRATDRETFVIKGQAFVHFTVRTLEPMMDTLGYQLEVILRVVCYDLAGNTNLLFSETSYPLLGVSFNRGYTVCSQIPHVIQLM